METVTRRRAVLFDFFGTLVEYRRERIGRAYPDSFQLARRCGYRGPHDEFVAAWDAGTRRLEERSRLTLREFDMTDAARAFSHEAKLTLSPGECAELGQRLIGEWQRGVQPISGVREMLQRLSATWTIGIVSNTHDPAMVPRLLERMGLRPSISSVTLSVDHGRCKPHRSIYDDALATIGVEATDAVFVGDSHLADYVGPSDAGIRAYLVDPDERHDVPAVRRLASVLDIEERVREERRRSEP